MHLTRMSIEWVPPFTEQIRLKFDERVNVFIGPNASGKSTVLQVIDERFNGRVEHSKRPLSGGIGSIGAGLCADDEFEEAAGGAWGFRPPNFLAASEDWLGTREQPSTDMSGPPAIYIGSVRQGLPGVGDQASPGDYGKTAAATLAGPFSGSRTMRASFQLGKDFWDEESWRAERDSPPLQERGELMNAVELADQCSQRICNEVIRDSRSHNYIHGLDVRGFLNHPHADPNNIQILRLMGIDTTDVRNFDILSYEQRPTQSAYREDPESLPIYLGHLSSGTEGTLLWIRWLALKLVCHYGFERGWEKKPAILLIDEIENHMHPTWQRRVIPALLEHFPGLQIFATTHSPFVVAGLKAGQVHLLKRDENGVVTATSSTEDVVGWTADEILRNMMGVDGPTDQLTVDRANRLRQLREKETLTAEEESELSDLRRQVNEDLLSKAGQLGAQQERYADLMERFLLSRQSGPTQDGE